MGPADKKWPLKGWAGYTFNFVGLGSSLVLSKVYVTHPNQADRKVGILMFKRVVSHTCTGNYIKSTCTKGTTVADVFKVGLCVKCNYDVFPHVKTKHQRDEHKLSFLNTCLPAAIDANGAVKSGFKCTGDDDKRAKAVLAGF